jgi:hypothetical protein
MPTERPPIVGEVSAKFSDRECHVVNVTDPYGRNLFLNRRFLQIDSIYFKLDVDLSEA